MFSPNGKLNWKDQLAQFYGNWLHEGQILDPVMRDIESFLENSQQNVTGNVFVQLMPYHFQIIGIESKYDLMSSKFGKYGEMNTGWSGEDVRGFSKIFGNQTGDLECHSKGKPGILNYEFQIMSEVSNKKKNSKTDKGIRVGIIGGAGYTGGELIRLLIHHPYVSVSFINSRSNAGKPVHSVHQDLLGDSKLKFTSELANDIDVLFLCVGHGEAKKIFEENKIDEKVKVIDLSQDFRLNQQSTSHNRQFVYGLPELNKEADPDGKEHCKPGVFCYRHSIGIAAACQSRFTGRYLYNRDHWLHRGRTGVNCHFAF
jgi:hypothetical protein